MTRDKPRVFRNTDRRWTVRRPGYGFGRLIEQSYRSFGDAIRPTERVGGSGCVQAEQASWPADGNAGIPAWQPPERGE